MEFAEESQLVSEGEVEKREGEREDEADEALGEEVEGRDGGEAEAWEEGGRSHPANPCLRSETLRQAQGRALGHPDWWGCELRGCGRGR